MQFLLSSISFEPSLFPSSIFIYFILCYYLFFLCLLPNTTGEANIEGCAWEFTIIILDDDNIHSTHDCWFDIIIYLSCICFDIVSCCMCSCVHACVITPQRLSIFVCFVDAHATYLPITPLIHSPTFFRTSSTLSIKVCLHISYLLCLPFIHFFPAQ